MKKIKQGSPLSGTAYPRIEIFPYNPEWPRWFELVQAKLQKCLGDLALSVDHIGSTAVPGLGSKNRIDIQVAVKEISDATQIALDRALSSEGFQEVKFSIDHCPSGEVNSDENWKKLYLSGVNLEPLFDFNIHIRAHGSKNYRYSLRFRDYLRCHPSVANGYHVFKEKLASYYPDNIEAYVEIKDPVCDIIIEAANEWFDKQ